MSLDLSEAVEAAARAWRDENARRFPAFATEWGDLPAATRRNDVAVMTVALAAAAPLIEAQVREQVAAEIEARMQRRPPIGATAADAWTNATERALRLARGESA